MHLGFVGFGLIGGSIARAVRANGAQPAWTIVAWSPSGTGPAQAVADGVIDVAATSPERAIDGADLIVLAGPPTACLAALDDLGGRWRGSVAPTAVITDVASTKGELLARADAAGLRYVGGHPMAGLEASGYAAARADLFVDRPWVIVPGRLAGPDDVATVEELVAACGARPVRLEAGAHDRAVAGISHLPLLLAAALAESVAGRTPGDPGTDWALATELAATGWRDMTRLARGDPAMGAGIAVTNGTALADRLRDLRATLDSWISALERPGGPDEAAIAERLRAIRARLDERS
jgi:prephenate dehydrogenase